MLVAAGLTLAALRASPTELPPSALRLAVTAVVGLLAPLFWPGVAASPARTTLRIGVWSAAAAGLAAIALRGLGGTAQPWARILASCAMLMAILLLTHAAAAGLEALLRVRLADAQGARETAGRTAVLALALLGALPLWLGPAAELLSSRHAWALDAAIGASPLTHLAVASGNDLLRNEWLYQNSNLAALPFSYPGLAPLAWSYATVCGLLALCALARSRWRRPAAEAAHRRPTQENTA